MIEVIKKKINLEEFKSRIPGLISVINQDDNFLNDGASWGKMPVLITILGRTIKYGTMMDLYYKLLDIITSRTIVTEIMQIDIESMQTGCVALAKKIFSGKKE